MLIVVRGSATRRGLDQHQIGLLNAGNVKEGVRIHMANLTVGDRESGDSLKAIVPKREGELTLPLTPACAPRPCSKVQRKGAAAQDFAETRV